MIARNQVVAAYAEALLNAVKRQNQLVEASAQATNLTDIFASNPRLHIFLETPNIPDRDKIALIEKVFKPKLLPLLTQFLLLFLRRRRLEHLANALAEFRRLVVHEQGMREASFVTAVELSFADKQLLEQAMEKVTGFDLQPTFTVDPKVLGGVLFRCEDMLIDSTLRSRLHAIGRRLATARVF